MGAVALSALALVTMSTMSTMSAISAMSAPSTLPILPARATLGILETLPALPLGRQQPPPVPQPFPRPGSQQPAQPQKPAQPQPPASTSAAKPSQPEGTPAEATLGVPVYPGAQFIASYDAGRGQRFYIFGSAAPFVDLVAYYRTTLKQKGELVFDIPATHEFDVGRYNEDAMAFPPGVTIKDFQSDVSEGYPNPKPNGQPPRFRSIIQIVPVAPQAR